MNMFSATQPMKIIQLVLVLVSFREFAFAETWSFDCKGRDHYQSRYINGSDEAFMDGIPNQSDIQLIFRLDSDAKYLKVTNDNGDMTKYDDKSPYMHVSHWSKDEREMFFASKMSSTVTLHKLSEGKFIAVEKYMDVTEKLDKSVVLKEFTKTYECKQKEASLETPICDASPFVRDNKNKFIVDVLKKKVSIFSVDSDGLTFIADPYEVGIKDTKIIGDRYLILLEDEMVVSINSETKVGVLMSKDQAFSRRFECSNKLIN